MRTITIAGTTRSDIPLIGCRFGLAAHRGESALSDVPLWDDTAAISHFDLASLKVVTVDEDATTPATRLYRGRIANHTVHRGDHVLGVARQWELQLQDYNWDLTGFRILGWERPAETDVQRVLALHAHFLNGVASISPRKRTTTALTTTYVPNTNTVNLAAKTYSDIDVADILREIAEIAGKTFFVTVDGQIFYDLDNSTAYAAGLSIDPATANGETVFAPLAGVSAEHGGQQIATGGVLRYGDDAYVEGSDVWGGEAFHDRFEVILSDSEVQTAAEAQALFSQIIKVRTNEDITYGLTLSLRADQVGLVKSGQTLNFKHPAADASSARTLRIVRLQWEPDAPEHYLAHLELGYPRVAAPRRNSRRKPDTKPIPAKPIPPTTDFHWGFEADTFDDTGTYEVGIPAFGQLAGGYLEADNFDTGGIGSPFIPLIAGETYTFTALLRNDSPGDGPIALKVQWYDNDGGSAFLRVDTIGSVTTAGEVRDTLVAPGTGSVFPRWEIRRIAGLEAHNNLAVGDVLITHGGDTTQPVGDDDTADTGTPGRYAPIDHVHEHGKLSPADTHHHGTAQIQGYVAGVTDHGALTGLADDDHLNLLNQTRHDALDHTGLVRDAGRWEVVMADGLTAPPEPVTNETEDDWVYGWVSG